MMERMYPGRIKLEVCRRLLGDWRDLAVLLEIPDADQARFEPGHEAREVWQWLEVRGRLGDLRPGLTGIGRGDLAQLLVPAVDLGPWRRVLELPADGRSYFAGRRRAIDHIARWLTSPAGKPVCVVTGDPGSGKTAVLAWFALQQDAVAAPGPAHRVRPGTVVAAVDARGLDADGVLKALVSQLGSAAGTFRELWDDLAGRAQPAAVVLDSVDESVDPATVLRAARDTLRVTTHPRVRLLVGARRHLVPRRHSATEVVDLDEDYADPAAVEAYINRILTTHETFRISAARTRRVAAAAAGAAGRSFLVAGLSAATIVERGRLPDPLDPLPSQVGEAMEAYLDALPVERRWAEDLLRPLAHARGPGLPMELWTLLAGELAGAPGEYGPADTRRLLEGPLSSFVVVSRRPGDGGSRSRATYRLFHEALDRHLTEVGPSYPEAPRPGAEARETIAAALLGSAPPDWADAEPYLQENLADHAAGTTVLTRLLRSAAFLVRAEPDSVIRALRRACDDDLTASQAYESVVHHLTGPAPVADRHAYLVLAARRVGDAALTADWEHDAPRPAWWPTAALWRRLARNRTLRRHNGPVGRVVMARPLGEHVVVSTDEEGAVAITGIVESGAATTPPLVIGDDPVEAAVVAELDGLPLVVVGDENGDLHTVDLPGGAVGGPGSAQAAPVSALAWDVDFPDRVASGRRDGTLELCSFLPPARLPGADRTDAEVFALVPIGRGAFAGATGSGRLFVWHPQMAVATVDDSQPRTTALAGTADAVVTGHDDGSVRYWPIKPGRLLDPTVIPPGREDMPPIVAVAAARPAGRLVVLVADEEGDVAVVDLATGERWADGPSGHEGPIWAMATFAVDGRTLVAGGGADGDVRLWQLDDLAVPAGNRTFLAAPWSPLRLAEHDGRLLCLALGGAREFAVLDALTGEVVDGPHTAPDDLSAATLVVVDGRLRPVAGTAMGQAGIGGTDWASVPEEAWIAGVTVAEGLLVAVRADGWVHFFGLDRAPRAGRDFRAGDDKVLGARLDGPDHLVLSHYSGRTSRWDLRTGEAALDPPPYEEESTWAMLGDARVDVGATVRDVLKLTDGRIAVATAHGVVVFVSGGQFH